MDATLQYLLPIHVHITCKNTEVRKFQSLKRNGTQISFDMTLEIGHDHENICNQHLRLYLGGLFRRNPHHDDVSSWPICAGMPQS